MFRKVKDQEVDITSLNHILKTGKNIMSIGYFMAIVCVILLGTYLLKEWNIFHYIGEFIVVISPIFIGFLIAWLFEPFVSWLQKKKVPRIGGCILVYFLIFSVLFLIAYFFIPAIASQVKDFVAAAPSIFEEITNTVMNFLYTLDTNNVFHLETVKEQVMNTISEFGFGIGQDMPKYLFTIGKSLISGGLNFVLGLMIGFYLLYDFDKVSHTIYSMLPESWKEGYQILTNRINTSLRGYVQGVLFVMLLVFITQSIGLTIAGLEAPILFAMFCAVTDVIPYFGPYIGGIPAVIVGFTISPITGICVIISILVVQLLENNFYQPLIMGHTMKLHPVTIMLGLLVFQHFFGILGMILATPCIACGKVIFVFFLEQTGYIKYFPIEKELKDDKVLVE